MKTQVIVGRVIRNIIRRTVQVTFTLYTRWKYKYMYIRTQYNVKLGFAMFTPRKHIRRVEV